MGRQLSQRHQPGVQGEGCQQLLTPPPGLSESPATNRSGGRQHLAEREPLISTGAISGVGRGHHHLVRGVPPTSARGASDQCEGCHSGRSPHLAAGKELHGVNVLALLQMMDPLALNRCCRSSGSVPGHQFMRIYGATKSGGVISDRWRGSLWPVAPLASTGAGVARRCGRVSSERWRPVP